MKEIEIESLANVLGVTYEEAEVIFYESLATFDGEMGGDGCGI